MNILSRVTWKSMWKNKTRTIVTIIGIILSAAMFMAVVTLGFSLHNYLLRGYIYESGDYYVRFSFSSQEQTQAMKEDERVSSVATAKIHGFTSLPYGEEEYAALDFFPLASVNSAYFSAMNVHLSEGRLPQNSSEVVVSAQVLRRLEGAGKTAELGNTVTLDFFTDTSSGNAEGMEYDYPEVEQREFSVTYTIVGVMEDVNNIVEHGYGLPCILTFQDGGEPDTLWNTLFAKTYKPSDAYLVAEEDYGGGRAVNNNVLLMLGATRYSNMNTVIIGICAVLIAIIMVGSVSLIYNSFAISVSERTRQFGLLSSIGATKRQLHNSILFEGAVLCIFGIPLGILCGWGGIAVTLKLMEGNIANLFAFGSFVPMRTVVSLPSILCAAIIGVVTVLISAAIPAKRATRIAPIAAIRQTEDYKVTANEVKVGKLTQSVFGLPGVMAKKYYSISRKKYRNTVISLCISVILFLSAAFFGNGLRDTAASSTGVHNYDFLVYTMDEEQQEILQELAQMEGIETVLLGSYTDQTILSLEDAEKELINYHELNTHDDNSPIGGNLLINVTISYVEDKKLEAWLKQEGIDPAPYLDSVDPLALVQELSATIYSEEGENTTRRTVTSYGIKDSVLELPLYSSDMQWKNSLGYEDCIVGDILTEDGLCYHIVPEDIWMESQYNGLDILHDMTVGDFYLMRLEDDAVSYYRYYPESREIAQEPAVTVPVERTSIRLGARVDNMILADSYADFYSIELVMPLSAMPDGSAELQLGINAEGNVEAVRKLLDESELPYNDYIGEEQQMRGTLLLIDVFSYGFIILISLICVVNVFNTISTNIALRRRDFGMLRSVGMKTGELYRMMNYECLIYGTKALLFGIPIGLLACYGIHQVFLRAVGDGFKIPWSAMAVAALCVFLVVFASMFYAVTKLRKDNPIDAIRQENL